MHKDKQGKKYKFVGRYRSANGKPFGDSTDFIGLTPDGRVYLVRKDGFVGYEIGMDWLKDMVNGGYWKQTEY